MYSLFRPLLFQLEPETAHHLIFGTAKTLAPLKIPLFLNRALYHVSSPALSQNVAGIHFENPVGLAAGFDKNAEIVDFMTSLGFGFLEVGSVTNLASKGNPQPRMFRLSKDKALINRMGLNNRGPEKLLANLEASTRKIPIGINIAKTNSPEITNAQAVEDFVNCYRSLGTVGAYRALNISCPNTKDGTTFEDPSALDELLSGIAEVRGELSAHIPLFVKFSADIPLARLEENIALSEKHGVDGFILVNTSTSRSGLNTSPARLTEIGPGGLSGRPLQEAAIEKTSHAAGILNKRKPIIGLGGIDSAETAYRFIRAGASLVQIYTGMIYQGPALCREINKGLLRLLERDGFANISEAVGTGE